MPEPAPPAAPATPPPPPAPGQTQSPPAPQPAADAPKPIVLLPDDYSALQRELLELRNFRTQTQAQVEAAEAERLKVLAAKGQAEDAMNQLKSAYETKVGALQSRAETIEQQWLSEKKTGAIAAALSGLEFAGVDPTVTAKHVRQLLEGEIESVLDRDGRPTVRDRQTLQPAEKYLRERLASPEFALYLKPTGRPGSGADGSRPAHQHGAGGEPKPGSLEAIVADWRGRQGQYQSMGLHRAQ